MMRKTYWSIITIGLCLLLSSCGGSGSSKKSPSNTFSDTTEISDFGIAGKITHSVARTKVVKVDIPEDFTGWNNNDDRGTPNEIHITDHADGELNSILLTDQNQMKLYAFYDEEYAKNDSFGETGHWDSIEWTITLASYESGVSDYICDNDITSTDDVSLGITGIALKYRSDTDDVKKGWTAYNLDGFSTACDIHITTHPDTENNYLIEGTFTATFSVQSACICNRGQNGGGWPCLDELEWVASDEESINIIDGRFRMYITQFEL